MSGTISRISVGLRPAITSSSSSSRGSVASARASSSRLRPATVSVPAGRSSRSPRPTCARHLGRPRRAPRRGWRGADGADGDVFAHAQSGERLHDLECARDAAPREPMRRHAGDVLAGEADRRRRSAGMEPGDDGEQRGLAGAVRADQRGDAAGRDRRARPSSTASSPPNGCDDALDRQAAASAMSGLGPARRGDAADDTRLDARRSGRAAQKR